MKKLFFITILVFSLTAKSQEKPKQSYNFSLDQAISHALINNYTAINSGRDIEISKQKKWETTANGLPQIS
jgi:outer membrane protein